jgi:hypothetical protein
VEWSRECVQEGRKEEEGGRGCVIERMCAWILFFLSLLVCSPVSHKGRQDMTGHEEIVRSVSCPVLFLVWRASWPYLIFDVWRAKVCFDTTERFEEGSF